MTNEEAIEIIEVARSEIEWEYPMDYAAAFDKAIEALEQEPCEDAISRNAVTRVLNNMDRYVADELKLCDTCKKFPANEVFVVDDVYEEIVESLPSVHPNPKTGHWIHYNTGWVSCDICQTSFPKLDRFPYMKYCAYCGAKMG